MQDQRKTAEKEMREIKRKFASFLQLSSFPHRLVSVLQILSSLHFVRGDTKNNYLKTYGTE